MTGPSPDRSVDRAALLGTSLAAVVALTFGGRGAWEWLASVVGLALLAVLVAFFRLSDSESVPVRERVALAAVAALCATLVVAAPLQTVLTLVGPVGGFCADVGAVAAAAVPTPTDPTPPGPTPAAVGHAAAQAAETASDECLGAATGRWLWVPALGFAAVFLGVISRAARRGGDPAGG